MKIFKHSVALIWGICVFSVFVTAVYSGGFEGVFQKAICFVVTIVSGLGLTAYGIIGIYESVRYDED